MGKRGNFSHLEKLGKKLITIIDILLVMPKTLSIVYSKLINELLILDIPSFIELVRLNDRPRGLKPE